MFLTVFDSFPLLCPKENRSRRSSLSRSVKNIDCEWIAPLAIYKGATVSESLFFMSESLFCSFANKNERFARKTDERIPNPEILINFWLASSRCK